MFDDKRLVTSSSAITDIDICVNERTKMIQHFDETGNLPPGIHWATWREFENRFGTNSRRKELLAGLRRAISVLRKAGCRTVFVDGSFVTTKELPGDFDACWSVEGVDPDLLDPVLLDFSNGRATQ